MTGKPTGLHHSQGFALVVTLSLMVLLTVIAIGLLSLSSTSLRSSANGEAQSQAVANARMAVTMALGELQKEAGDDRRITADASLWCGKASRCRALVGRQAAGRQRRFGKFVV
jgi:Tfp pilus assembly protein PilX